MGDMAMNCQWIQCETTTFIEVNDGFTFRTHGSANKVDNVPIWIMDHGISMQSE